MFKNVIEWELQSIGGKRDSVDSTAAQLADKRMVIYQTNMFQKFAVPLIRLVLMVIDVAKGQLLKAVGVLKVVTTTEKIVRKSKQIILFLAPFPS
jgi:hypothetical protein